MRCLPFVFGISAASCALVTDLRGLGNGGADAASPDDGGVDGDSAVPGNLLTNGDFDEGTGGCGPGWTATNGTLTRSATARSGAASCEVCVSTGSWTNVHASPRPVASPATGATYYAQVWVKPETADGMSSVALDIEESGAGGTLAWQEADPSNTAWQLVQAGTKPAAAGGTDIDFSVHLVLNDGGAGCVLIDDAQLLPQ